MIFFHPIKGIGTDLVDVRRIESLYQKHEKKFIDRIFTAGEQAYCERQKKPLWAYAKRFAAKEAASKALGYGIGSRLAWTDMEVTHDKTGQPKLLLPLRIRLRKGIGKSFLSLSDEYPYAQAFVILT